VAHRRVSCLQSQATGRIGSAETRAPWHCVVRGGGGGGGDPRRFAMAALEMKAERKGSCSVGRGHEGTSAWGKRRASSGGASARPLEREKRYHGEGEPVKGAAGHGRTRGALSLGPIGSNPAGVLLSHFDVISSGTDGLALLRTKPTTLAGAFGWTRGGSKSATSGLADLHYARRAEIGESSASVRNAGKVVIALAAGFGPKGTTFREGRSGLGKPAGIAKQR